jgi:hypothetical protein
MIRPPETYTGTAVSRLAYRAMMGAYKCGEWKTGKKRVKVEHIGQKKRTMTMKIEHIP